MRTLLGMGMFLLLVSTAFAVDTKTDYDHSANFANIRTYAFRSSGQPESIVNNSLVRSRVHTAVGEALSSRGIRVTNSKPDVYMVIHVDAQQMEDVNYFPAYGGWYPNAWYGFGPDVSVFPYVQGTLIIDMVDANTNKLVWRAISSDTGSNLIDVQSPKKVGKMVYKAFKHYPV